MPPKRQRRKAGFSLQNAEIQLLFAFRADPLVIPPGLRYLAAHQAPGPFGPAALGDSSTVEQRTLTPLILVRIQVPQPFASPEKDSGLHPHCPRQH